MRPKFISKKQTNEAKFIFVSGGVISGLGKGITTASIAFLLKSCGLKVAPVKCDMYLNIDAGTMNPLEHGEIFVTDDGTEADQDLGHYERFLNQNLGQENYITAGQIYQQVLEKERALEYDGKCVDAYIHIPQEIVKRFEKLGKKVDIVIIEFGGTVGEYQNIMFFEAARRMKIKYQENVFFVHVGYLPVPPSIGEMKTKPIQQSIHELNELGIQPDIIICRSEKTIDKRRKEKIALAAALGEEDIFSNPDVENPYEVPLILDRQKFTRRLFNKLKLKSKKKELHQWASLINQSKKSDSMVKIGMVGKYYTSGGFSLEDSYISVIESIKHAAWANKVKPQISWIDSEKIETLSSLKITEVLKNIDGIIVPQGWGSRGVEGKIKAVQFARENKIPYLGLCFGMQMAVIEFARDVVNLPRANSTEVNPKTPHPVVHIMPDQKKYLEKHQYGGTIRLGAWPCQIKPNTLLHQMYSNSKGVANFNSRQRHKLKSANPIMVQERHRHRYEFNNRYRRRFEKAGMKISGVSPDKKLVEAVEILNHPFFIGTQFHPEYQSRPLSPHPLFVEFVKAAMLK